MSPTSVHKSFSVKLNFVKVDGSSGQPYWMLPKTYEDNLYARENLNASIHYDCKIVVANITDNEVHQLLNNYNAAEVPVLHYRLFGGTEGKVIHLVCQNKLAQQVEDSMRVLFHTGSHAVVNVSVTPCGKQVVKQNTVRVPAGTFQSWDQWIAAMQELPQEDAASTNFMQGVFLSAEWFMHTSLLSQGLEMIGRKLPPKWDQHRNGILHMIRQWAVSAGLNSAVVIGLWEGFLTCSKYGSYKHGVQMVRGEVRKALARFWIQFMNCLCEAQEHASPVSGPFREWCCKPATGMNAISTEALFVFLESNPAVVQRLKECAIQGETLSQAELISYLKACESGAPVEISAAHTMSAPQYIELNIPVDVVHESYLGPSMFAISSAMKSNANIANDWLPVAFLLDCGQRIIADAVAQFKPDWDTGKTDSGYRIEQIFLALIKQSKDAQSIQKTYGHMHNSAYTVTRLRDSTAGRSEWLSEVQTALKKIAELKQQIKIGELN